MHLSMGSLNLSSSLRGAAVAARSHQCKRGGGRAVWGVRAEIKKILSPDGVAEDKEGVTFKEPPAFDRSISKTGIMHIGVGGFHRSHQQVRRSRPPIGLSSGLFCCFFSLDGRAATCPYVQRFVNPEPRL